MWAAAIGIGLFVFSVMGWLIFVNPGPRECARNVGFDFMAFYTAGSFVREGRAADLYDIEKVRAFEQTVAAREGMQLGKSVGPWWNPPFYGWAFAPLSTLPFHTAVGLWIVINALAAAGAGVLLVRMFQRAVPASTWRSWGLIPLLLAASTPLLQTATHGQNAGTSLLLLTLAVRAWRERNALVAGIWIGLLSYKPQLAALLGIVLLIDLGWRAALSMSATVGTLLLINLVTLPGTLADYLHRLPGNLHYMQVENPYIWDRHVTLRAFWRLLFQGNAPGEMSHTAMILAVGSTLLLGGFLAWTIYRTRAIRSMAQPVVDAGQSRDRMIAATITCTPLLMPFYFDYDLILLAVPAVLIAINGSRNIKVDLIAWGALFVWLYLNPFLAEILRVNGAVVFLTFVATRLLAEANRSHISETNVEQPLAPPSRRFAA